MIFVRDICLRDCLKSPELNWEKGSPAKFAETCPTEHLITILVFSDRFGVQG